MQSPLFQKQKKKLYKSQIESLDKEIKKILDNPQIGVEKRGTLQGVRVHKFYIKNQIFLLAYEYSSTVLSLIMLGTHENYYRDLKKYY